MTSYEDRIKNGFQEKPEYRVDENAPINAPVNAPVKLSDLQENIIRQLQQNPTVTYDKLSELFQKDRATIKRNIRLLKESNIIKRIGPYKNGYWQVLL
ncbi:MAG TPA: winged helix-turn-helix transcriptional regulator [Candidatus Kapabacteria bacterium]|nr:winged helix-turn-helix transcriptional regulator [Candidatus Kapabacteria bacterium]